MKKVIAFLVTTVFILSLFGCGKNSIYEISITIPAESTNQIFYSDEEISPTKNTLKISSGEGLGDTSVTLLPIEVTKEKSYEGDYLTGGITVKMDVEKGAWYKVGITAENPSDKDIVVTVKVENVEVRVP